MTFGRISEKGHGKGTSPKAAGHELKVITWSTLRRQKVASCHAHFRSWRVDDAFRLLANSAGSWAEVFTSRYNKEEHGMKEVRPGGSNDEHDQGRAAD